MGISLINHQAIPEVPSKPRRGRREHAQGKARTQGTAAHAARSRGWTIGGIGSTAVHGWGLETDIIYIYICI